MHSVARFRSPLLNQRSAWGLLLLLVSAFLGNYFRWTLFFGIDFVFGSIAVWLVVCLYGLRWGTLAGLISGICTYLIWGHPYTAITFTAEAWVVGWLFHRRQQNNIVLLTAAFWLVLGMPLVWLFYAILLKVDSTQAFIILLKQPINGVFNALVASLLLTHLPIHRWVSRPPAIKTLSLQQTLFNLLVAFVMVPILVLTILASNRVVDDIKNTVRLDLNDASRYLTVEVRTWYERRLSAVKALADAANRGDIDQITLNQYGELIQRLVPDLRHLHVLDASGQLVLDIDNNNLQSQSILQDRLYFEQLQRSPQIFLAPVKLHPRASSTPTVVLAIPIVQDQTLMGAVLGELDLKELTTLLQANVGQQLLDITLIDQRGTVAASTRRQWIGQPQFDWRAQGEVDVIADRTYQWFPLQGSHLFMVRWNNSVFVQETLVERDLPWTLIVQMAATPHVQQIEQANTNNMVLLLLVSSGALLVATFVSRQLVKPVVQLADVTTNLPDKLLEQEPIYWIQTQVAEFALLVANFRSMAASLQQKFGEIQQANETLEQRVQERTQALQKSNAALGESEARFRQMAENIREVFWMQTIDRQQLLYISPGYEEIWGRTCESLYASPRSFLEAIHPEDREFVINSFIQPNHELVSVEYRIIQPNGSIRWIWDRAFPIRDQAGEYYRVVGVAQDITERKQAELIVRQQAERERLLGTIALQIRQSLQLDDILRTTVAEVRQFLQTDRVIMYQFQADWSGLVLVESVAEGWRSLLGQHLTDSYFLETRGERYRQGDIVATADIYHAGLADCHIELLEGLQVRASLIVPILQGEILWGLLVAQHCRAPRDWYPSEMEFLRQLTMQVAIAIHQSELYQHEQRLNTILEQQVEERTAQLQQALRYEAMLQRITDKVRDSLDENQILQTAVEELGRGLEVYGCDTALFDLAEGTMTVSHSFTNGSMSPHPEVLLVTNFSDIYPQLLQGQHVQFCELIPHFMDEAWQPRTVFACPIIDDQGVLGKLRLFRPCDQVFNDSELRVVLQVANQCAIAIRQARLYQVAQVKVKALEELNQLKDDFLSTVSHELRTPISNMKMAIHMLQMLPTEDRRQRYMEILQSECAREAELINDLLDLQRLASGTRVLDLESIDVLDWLDELLPPFRERSQDRQQQLQVTVDPHLSTWISDRACLTRILAELLNNACKYTPPGERIHLLVESGRVSLPESRDARVHLRLTVRNTGVEIPAAELPRIFDKFYRIPGIDRWKQGGTGLGLALIQKLIELIGGTIRVQSHGNCTCFIVELPRQEILPLS